MKRKSSVSFWAIFFPSHSFLLNWFWLISFSISSADIKAFTCQERGTEAFSITGLLCNQVLLPFCPGERLFPCPCSAGEFQADVKVRPAKSPAHVATQKVQAVTNTASALAPSACSPTLRTMEDRKIQRYGCRTEAASHVLLLLVCSPFTLSVLLAGSPLGGHDLKV